MDTSKESKEFDFSLDFLLQETLLLSEKINREIQVIQDEYPTNFEDIIKNFEKEESKIENSREISTPVIPSVTEISKKLYPDESDQDFLFNLVDEVYEKGLSAITDKEPILRQRNLLDFAELRIEAIQNIESESVNVETILENKELETQEEAPHAPGIIYRLDRGANTFCIRGFSTDNINLQLNALEHEPNKLLLLKATSLEDQICYFETKTFEVAEIIKDQMINRRFPIQEDAVCNISDPGFSWWMDITPGRFEIFFKSHAINREEKFLKLGPIGDAKVAAIRFNQAHALLRGSFPLSEFSCTEKSFIVSSAKPDHLSFITFQNIFSLGENSTLPENFPNNTIGKTLYYYFLEIATLRKFWIEVDRKLS